MYTRNYGNMKDQTEKSGENYGGVTFLREEVQPESDGSFAPPEPDHEAPDCYGGSDDLNAPASDDDVPFGEYGIPRQPLRKADQCHGRRSLRRVKLPEKRSLPEPDDDTGDDAPENMPPENEAPDCDCPPCEKPEEDQDCCVCPPKPPKKPLCTDDFILIALTVLLICEGADDELILILAMLLLI